MRRGTLATSSGTVGAALATITALAWGGQFVVGKSALERVDAFHLTTLRYAAASLVMLALLAAFEGRRALSLGGRGWRLFALGTLGFAGFNLFAFTGLEHAEPQSAALIVALGPLLTALVLWLQKGIRPSRSTFVLLLVALAGVALVISGGDPASILDGSIGWGDALVLAGVISFVLYTLGAAEFRDFSPLRYTALTAGLGWLSIAGATLVADLANLEPTPSGADVWATVPELAYISIIGAVIAVVCWNAAVGAIGPQNTALFANLIPVTTFGIEIVRGYRPNALEIAGAALTVAALSAQNLLARRAVSRASTPAPRASSRAHHPAAGRTLAPARASER
jgi:drug/metabolite transporter (DMT)-like permease